MSKTDNHTITFSKNHLEILLIITKRLVVDKAVILGGLDREQEENLVEVRNLIQKSLDFPDLKF